MTQKITITGGGEVDDGSSPTLTSNLDPATPGATGWKWEFKSPDAGSSFRAINETTNVHTIDKVSDDSAGTYQATATTAGGPISGTTEVTIKKVQPKPAETPEKPEPPAEWHRDFAACFAAITASVLLLFVLLSGFFRRNLGLEQKAYDKLDGRSIVGARLIGPIAVVGVVVLAVGVWMTAVEWRGRFKPKNAPAPTLADTAAKKKKGAAVDPVKLVEALGKLKGATLVLIVGALIIWAAAWMTSSTTSSDPPPATTEQPTTTTQQPTTTT